ncbi:hypothetical protein ACFL1Z_03435 [Thermodesulfobacteriota bacterium]
MVKICYLCGKSIKGRVTMDHVLPKQIFTPKVRQKHNLSQLKTLPTHKHCNESYQSDEDYFVWTLAPIALGSHTANAIADYHAKKFRSGKSVGLGKKILKQLSDQPGTLYLPRNQVTVRVEGARINRVAWKIIRGLYWIEKGSLLPENTKYYFELIEPENRDKSVFSEIWEIVKAQPSKGIYAGVFDYKYFHAKKGGMQLHLWGMLLWDRIMLFISHHNPNSIVDDTT